MPADHGLTSLGLLMQLGGAIFCGIFAVFALLLLLTGAPMDLLFTPVALAVLSAIRSGYHYRAGRALVHGPPHNSSDGPLSATARYIKVAAIHTALCTYFLYDEVSGEPVATMFAVWAVWPLAMFLLLRSARVRAMHERIPRAEDLALEGASMYMLLFGIVGVLIASLSLYQLYVGVGFVTSFDILAVYVVVVLMVCRSLMHARAGRIGITGDLDSAAEYTRRYTRFSATSTAAIMVLIILVQGRDTLSLSVIAMLGLVAFLLLSWPRIISHFMAQRVVDGYSSRGQASARRAPDMGLTALGWLLLSLALYGLATTVPTLLFDAGRERWLGEELFYTTPLAARFGHSLWYAVVIHGLQLWAALELIRMLDGYKIPTVLYGVVGTALTVYMIWPFFDQDLPFAQLIEALSQGGGITVIGEIGVALAIPLAVLFMVHRQLPAQARARFRAKEEAGE